MGLEVFKDSQQGAGFVICIVSAPICTLATILRIISTKRAGRKFGMEDWFAFAALVFYLAYVGMFLYVLLTVNGRSVIEVYLTAPDTATSLVRVSWVMSTQFAPNQTFAKCCLLALYYRLFSVDHVFTLWLRFLTTVQVGWGIAVYLVGYFGCEPIYKSWDVLAEGTCIDTNAFLVAKEVINSVIDLAMAALAVWVLRVLRIGKWAKFKVSFLFLIGGVSGIMGFVKTGQAQNSQGNNFLNAIWDVVQMATSIICCCAPIYRSVLPDLGIFTKLRSWASRSFSSQSKSSPSGSNAGSSGNPKAATPRGQPWLHLDGWSQKELTWSEMEANRDTRHRQANSVSPESGMEMGSTTVHTRSSADAI